MFTQPQVKVEGFKYSLQKFNSKDELLLETGKFENALLPGFSGYPAMMVNAIRLSKRSTNPDPSVNEVYDGSLDSEHSVFSSNNLFTSEIEEETNGFIVTFKLTARSIIGKLEGEFNSVIILPPPTGNGVNDIASRALIRDSLGRISPIQVENDEYVTIHLEFKYRINKLNLSKTFTVKTKTGRVISTHRLTSASSRVVNRDITYSIPLGGVTNSKVSSIAIMYKALDSAEIVRRVLALAEHPLKRVPFVSLNIHEYNGEIHGVSLRTDLLSLRFIDDYVFDTPIIKTNDYMLDFYPTSTVAVTR